MGHRRRQRCTSNTSPTIRCFSHIYATHLGLAVLGDEQAPPGKCTDCNDAIHDTFASHALKCKSFVTPRHNAARDLLRHIISPIADGDVEIEQSCGVDGRPKQTHNAPGEFRQGDVAVRLKGQAKYTFLDISPSTLHLSKQLPTQVGGSSYTTRHPLLLTTRSPTRQSNSKLTS